MSDADRFETLYNKFRPIVDRMTDAQIVEAIDEARTNGTDKLIVAALVAEATARGI